MSIDDTTNVIPIIFSYINKHGLTDKSTGLHFHFSVNGVDFKTDTKLHRLFKLNDEQYIYSKFPDRKKSKYCRPTADLRYNKIDKPCIYTDIISKLNIRNRNYGINLKAIDKIGTIEYRYLGGPKYQNK